MKTVTNNPAPVAGFGWLFEWIDNNPRSSSALLWLLFVASLVSVFYYRFTTVI